MRVPSALHLIGGELLGELLDDGVAALRRFGPGQRDRVPSPTRAMVRQEGRIERADALERRRGDVLGRLFAGHAEVGQLLRRVNLPAVRIELRDRRLTLLEQRCHQPLGLGCAHLALGVAQQRGRGLLLRIQPHHERVVRRQLQVRPTGHCPTRRSPPARWRPQRPPPRCARSLAHRHRTSWTPCGCRPRRRPRS